MKHIGLRWLVRDDIPEVLAIERASFDQAWDENDLLACLRERNIVGQVADDGRTIHGFCVYELRPKRLRLLNLAVKPESRRQGVGFAIVDRLKDKLCHMRRVSIDTHVRERNLCAQVFFRAMGFRWMGTERGYWEDGSPEDAYWFRYRLGGVESPVFTNRVSSYFEADV